MAKNKYYVVWNGRQVGVYSNWDSCKMQIEGFKGAQYKSFPDRASAEQAFNAGYEASCQQSAVSNQQSALKSYENFPEDQRPIGQSIAVDAACSKNPGPVEYRGVDTKSGITLFKVGPLADGTNNIGEFLAIVHALALLKQKSPTMTIYSDSKIAQLWVMKRECKTKLERTPKTEKLLQDVDRAVAWLHNNTYQNKILKWKTEEWGEIPADFGRK